jgi:CHAT domain-containing protein
MLWSLPRSLTVALAGATLGTFPWSVSAPICGQDSPATAAAAPDADPAQRADKLDASINQRLDAGQVAEAVAPAREKLDLLERTLGKDHWQTGDARGDVETYHRLASLAREVQDRYAKARQAEARGAQLCARGQYAEAALLFQENLSIRRDILGERHLDTAGGYNDLAVSLRHQGKAPEAERMHRRALAIYKQALGEGNPRTATSYNNLAETLRDQGKYAEAEAMQRRTLAIYLRSLGVGQPRTAVSYHNLAGTLGDEGKHAEAEAMHRRALAIRLKVLGERHPQSSASYNSLAESLRYQGKYAEAEAMQRRALAIRLKALGESHADTAASYNNLAETLRCQGKYAEAEAMQRRALAIKLKSLGEGHPRTAASYNNLATTLGAQGKHAEAELLYRRALAIHVKALGEGHARTGNNYNNLAGTLGAQGKHAEAEAMHRRALAIYKKALGESHHLTATSYNNLALTLAAEGNYAEAEAMHRRCLGILLKALGESHPHTAISYSSLARCLDRQGKDDDALRTWSAAAASYERARLQGTKGLDAALTPVESPLASFALALARAGRPCDAWTRWEQGLARGLGDEVTRRAARPLTAAERAREARLLGQAQALDEGSGKLLAKRALSQEQDKLFEDLKLQGSETRRQMLELEQQLESRYGAIAGQPATLQAVQKTLPEGTALVGWIDDDAYHWACLLRHCGAPIWVGIPGSGKGRAWTKQDEELAQRLRAELDPQTTGGHSRPLGAAMARQRLEPLKEHLHGVNRLVVVNSPGLAGVPIEVLMAAQPASAWAGISVAYVPSASVFAHLAAKPPTRDRDRTLLALADPAYPQANQDNAAPTPPVTGFVMARIVPNGNADLNGIRPGDVLLAYAGTTLKTHADLKTVADDRAPKRVPVRYWREGVTRVVEVAAGPLGITIDSRPPAAAIEARRTAERVLLGMPGGPRAPLPGTRREVEAIARLFPDGAVTTLTGERACESTVQRLARSGELKAFRYLHFAAHGESDPRHAYRTALILAPDADRSADPLAFEGDGTITAEQIARTWELDAELVVLSACESGLGRAAGAEGYLGFAQPLLAKGARSLVLSQWKVDDDASALLMTRFYQNLLGARAGLESPLRKAEALAESKAWLRSAGPEEIGAALAALPRGSIVRREVVAPKSGTRPYEDPTYWAAFILIGSPD